MRKVCAMPWCDRLDGDQWTFFSRLDWTNAEPSRSFADGKCCGRWRSHPVDRSITNERNLHRKRGRKSSYGDEKKYLIYYVCWGSIMPSSSSSFYWFLLYLLALSSFHLPNSRRGRWPFFFFWKTTERYRSSAALKAACCFSLSLSLSLFYDLLRQARKRIDHDDFCFYLILLASVDGVCVWTDKRYRHACVFAYVIRCHSRPKPYKSAHTLFFSSSSSSFILLFRLFCCCCFILTLVLVR